MPDEQVPFYQENCLFFFWEPQQEKYHLNLIDKNSVTYTYMS